MFGVVGFFLSMIILSLLNFSWWNMNCVFLLGMFILCLGSSSRSVITNASLCLGETSLSHSLVLLSVWILALSILCSKKISKTPSNNKFMLTILIMNLILILTFYCLNSLFFFFLFESSLIPTLYLIMGWGYKVERVKSGFYMLFYTVFGSLPLMVVIINHFLNFYTVHFSYMYFFQSSFMFICIMMGFMVKMPMFLVHSWLPKAHVEAPVSGSMILAGILLKLGGYGVLKFTSSISFSISKFSLPVMCLSLVGGVLSSLICLRQTDMKSLIAYSSVSHMSLVIAGMFSQNYWGSQFSILMMIGHGLCSSGLFYLTNINYERCYSRSIYLNKGMISLLPNLSMWWFLFNACNMACPPSLNLLSEIGLMNSILSWCVWSIPSMFLISFLSACYSLYLFSFTQHGMLYSGLMNLNNCFLLEFLVLFLHWIPLNTMFMFSEVIF